MKRKILILGLLFTIAGAFSQIDTIIVLGMSEGTIRKIDPAGNILWEWQSGHMGNILDLKPFHNGNVWFVEHIPEKGVSRVAEVGEDKSIIREFTFPGKVSESEILRDGTFFTASTLEGGAIHKNLANGALIWKNGRKNGYHFKNLKLSDPWEVYDGQDAITVSDVTSGHSFIEGGGMSGCCTRIYDTDVKVGVADHDTTIELSSGMIRVNMPALNTELWSISISAQQASDVDYLSPYHFMVTDPQDKSVSIFDTLGTRKYIYNTDPLVLYDADMLFMDRGDDVSPGKINTLNKTGQVNSQIKLSFIAPGDDGFTGIVSGYDLRYSGSTLTEENWENATRVILEPPGQVANSIQNIVLTELYTGTYYLGIKSYDDAGKVSELSNILSLSVNVMEPSNEMEFIEIIDSSASYISSPAVCSYDRGIHLAYTIIKNDSSFLVHEQRLIDRILRKEIINTGGGTPWTPELCLDNSGNLHLVWQEQTDGNVTGIYYGKFNGTAWSLPEKVSETNIYAWDPKILSDNDKLWVVWSGSDSLDTHSDIYITGHSGETWSAPQNLSHSELRMASIDLNPRSPLINKLNDTIIVAWTEFWGDHHMGGYRIAFNRMPGGESWGLPFMGPKIAECGESVEREFDMVSGESALLLLCQTPSPTENHLTVFEFHGNEWQAVDSFSVQQGSKFQYQFETPRIIDFKDSLVIYLTAHTGQNTYIDDACARDILMLTLKDDQWKGPFNLSNSDGYSDEAEIIRTNNGFYLFWREMGKGKFKLYQSVNLDHTYELLTDPRDGLKYRITQIGYQAWMADNLEFYHPGSHYYLADSTTYSETYARLYVYTAASDVCLPGWHLPDTSEWGELIEFAGGHLAGGAFKEKGDVHWLDPNQGATNLTGFSALPGGKRDPDGSYDGLGSYVWFWSGTESGSGAYAYRFAYDTILIDRFERDKSSSLSVRCTKDTVFVNKDDISCPGENDGSISMDVRFGIPPLQYAWSSGPDTRDIAGLEPGTYTVIITDSRDSTYELSTEIIEPDSVKTNLSGTNICDTDEKGAIDLDVSGGISPYNYNWSNDSSSQDLYGLEPGLYKITVTDANGCMVRDSIILTLHDEPVNLQLTVSNQGYLCDDVVIDAGSGYTNYHWSTGETSSQIVVSTPGEIGVTVYNQYMCSESDTVLIMSAPVLAVPQICIVTVDLSTGKNIIVWEKPETEGISCYNVYREGTSAGSYERIGSVGVNDLSIFKDTTGSPEEHPHIYSLTAVDICGNESEKAPWHRTLFLQYVFGNLNWSEYFIQDGSINFLTYEIYRGSETQQLQWIRDVSASFNLWTDPDPMAMENRFYYRIGGIKPDPCQPSGGLKADTDPVGISISNIINNGLTPSSIQDDMGMGTMLIFPNPAKNRVTVHFPNPEGSQYDLVLTEMSGKVVLKKSLNSDRFELELNQLGQGLYLLSIHGEKTFRSRLEIQK